MKKTITFLCLIALMLCGMIERSTQSNLWSVEITELSGAIADFNIKSDSVNFEKLRIGFKNLEPLFFLYFDEDKIFTLNNNKHWVAVDSVFLQDFEEAGLMQQLEKCVYQNFDITPAMHQKISLLEDILHVLPVKIEADADHEDRIFYEILKNIYRQYTFGLSGSERLKTRYCIQEFDCSVALILKMAAQKQITHRAKKQITMLQNCLKSQQSFENIDRVTLLTTHISPLVSSLALKLKGQYNDKINLTAKSIFSTAFLQKKQPDKHLSALGKLFFYDTQLSGNAKRSCASCHQPQKSFSDGRVTSEGFRPTQRLLRNSPTLINASYKHYLGHDMAKGNLSAQIFSVVNDVKEFNTDTTTLARKLNSNKQYLAHIKKHYKGKLKLDFQTFTTSIDAFLAELSLFESPIDQLMRGTKSEINPKLKESYNLFMGKAQCGTCHFPPLFDGTDLYSKHRSMIFNINLPHQPHTEIDYGIYASKPNYKHFKYKNYFAVPTLRQLKYTAPYFHNGQTENLIESLSHIQKHFELNFVSSEILIFLENLNATTPKIYYPNN